MTHLMKKLKNEQPDPLRGPFLGNEQGMRPEPPRKFSKHTL